MQEEDTVSIADLRIGGTEVHYFVLCPRKLWWFSHGLEQEHAGGSGGGSVAGQENVALGTLLHEQRYPDKDKRKDVLIDDLLRLDFTEAGVVHEVKKSHGGARAERATRAQLLYYLFYLKREKGIETTGVIDYPNERRRENVVLTPDAEAEIETLLRDLDATRRHPLPPDIPAPMTLCKKCAYQELCWG